MTPTYLESRLIRIAWEPWSCGYGRSLKYKKLWV